VSIMESIIFLLDLSYFIIMHFYLLVLNLVNSSHYSSSAPYIVGVSNIPLEFPASKINDSSIFFDTVLSLLQSLIENYLANLVSILS
jgi:hypothetical protein